MNQPNVLVICSDEHARRYSGCYGHPAIHTPTLNRLSERGVTFDNAYTPSPICIPARASLATGRQVHETGCWSSAQAYCGQTESWMHLARERGCTVISIGKLHFRSAEDDNGFTEEILPMYLANDGIGWPIGLLRNPLPKFRAAFELAERIGCGESEYTEYDRKITTAACGWIHRWAAKSRARPWVLFVSFVSPHYPLTAPEKFYRLYENSERLGQPMPVPTDGYVEHPVIGEMRRFWNYDDYFTDELRIQARKNYFGLVSFLDDNIRQVLEALEKCRNTRDTLILYTSDHGEMLGHLGLWTKSVMYEDSVGIPLIANGNGFKPGRCAAPVSLTNISRTVLEAVGVDASEPLSCLEESLQSVATKPDRSRYAFSQYHDGGTPVGFFMVREHDFKLVHYTGGHPPQLFHLTADPLEIEDLAQNRKYATQLEKLQNRLHQILDPDEIIENYTTDQVALIEKLGGRDKILSLWDFNHTPMQ